MNDSPDPCSSEALALGCSCIPMQDGSIVVSPYCLVHLDLTDRKHGTHLDLRKVIPPPGVPSPSTCVHDPIPNTDLSIRVGMPISELGLVCSSIHEPGDPVLAVQVCRKCRLVYLA